MSGRSLRRLPVLAHARYIGTLPMLAARTPASTRGIAGKAKGKSAATEGGVPSTQIEVWLDAIERVIETQRAEKDRLDRN